MTKPDPTPEQQDLQAVRQQISETDAAIAELADDLPAIELRLALNKPAEDGDEDLLTRHASLIAKLASLRRAETAALRAVEEADLQRHADLMRARERGYSQHVGSIKRHMLAAQAAMETMYKEYSAACQSARSAISTLPPGPIAARGGPGRSILNVRFLQRLMTVELVRNQRQAGDQEAWLLRTNTLEFQQGQGVLPPMAEIIDQDAAALKSLFARDWLRAQQMPPPKPRTPPKPIEEELVINASSVPFSPPVKPEAEPGVVNLSSTEFAPPAPAEPTADDGEAA